MTDNTNKVISAIFCTTKFKKDQVKALEEIAGVPGFVSAKFSVEEFGFGMNGIRIHYFECVFDPALIDVRTLNKTKFSAGKFSEVKRVFGFIL